MIPTIDPCGVGQWSKRCDGYIDIKCLVRLAVIPMIDPDGEGQWSERCDCYTDIECLVRSASY